MQRLFSVTLPIPPSVNNYQGKTVRQQGTWSKVHFFPTKETIEWEQYAATTIKREIANIEEQFPIPRHRYVVAKIKFFFKQRKEDADNHFKVPFDLLQSLGIVENDDQLLPLVENVYVRKGNPAMVMTLYLANKYGIFDTEQDYKEFVFNNCNICRRNKSCKLREEAVSNHLTESIDRIDLICKEQNILKKYRK